MQLHQPNARGGRPLVCFMTASVVATIAIVAGRCFSAPGMQPSVTLPKIAGAPNVARTVHKAESTRPLAAADSLTNSLTMVEGLTGSMEMADVAFAGLQPGEREVNVAMFNKKRTRRDHSEGWTFRKKYRTCSTLARAATKAGRKILKARTKRGKKRISPGDWINPKMMPLKRIGR
mmetsp:Transcript_95836/g.184828  ORF Transcript_95836/g.184828 Transcript_95836/m.184828 type:complete len:176 (-) Transcript_95836:109-636(-)